MDAIFQTFQTLIQCSNCGHLHFLKEKTQDPTIINLIILSVQQFMVQTICTIPWEEEQGALGPMHE